MWTLSHRSQSTVLSYSRSIAEYKQKQIGFSGIEKKKMSTQPARAAKQISKAKQVGHRKRGARQFAWFN